MKNIIVILIMMGIFVAFISCNNKSAPLNMDMEKQLVEKAIHSCIGWAKNKDINLLYSIIANDSVYIEVSPSDHITYGFQNFKNNEKFWLSPDFKAIRYEIKDLKINFSQSGTVAWFFARLDDINEWKGQPASWENTRWTGVLERRNNCWVMVQMHFSFASPQ